MIIKIEKYSRKVRYSLLINLNFSIYYCHKFCIHFFYQCLIIFKFLGRFTGAGLSMGGDLERLGDGSPKFEVGDGSCIRPPIFRELGPTVIRSEGKYELTKNGLQ